MVNILYGVQRIQSNKSFCLSRVRLCTISTEIVIEKTVTDKVTTLNVDITWDIEGIHKTNNYNIEFVFEDDEWKLNSDVIRYHP